MGRPERIGDLQPFAELAAGPTATVYKAYQASLDRFVLLKILRPELAEDETFVQRFEEEARLAARVQHPNVVAVYAFGREGPHVYFATEFVEGLSLRELLTHGSLPPALALYVAAEVARGLKAAHEKGVLHRDLKPANILISYTGQVKLTDFGMASLLSSGGNEEVRGTPGYLAPEQVLGEAPGPAADLFALGATLFEMLTGTPAFLGETPGEIFDALLHHDPIPRLQRLAAVPDDVIALCARLLAKRPEARYPDATALLQDLEALRQRPELRATPEDLATYIDHPEAFPRMPVQPVVTTPPRPVSSSAHRPRWHLVVGAIATLTLLGLLLLAGPWPFTPQRSMSPSSAASTTIQTTTPPESLVASPVGSQLSPDTTVSPVRPSPSTANLPRPSEERLPSLPPPDTPHLSLSPLPETQPDPARLQLEVTPWAYVLLERPDGIDSLGATPLDTPLTLPAGSYTLHLHNPEFPPYRLSLKLQPGQDTLVAVSLWLQVARLWLEVHPWAHVYIDNRYYDVIPPQEQPFILEPGIHRLQLVHPELGTFDTLLQLQAHTAETLRVDLLRRHPQPER
ncbi:MAG: protein kinase [Rhodothermus sp.]|nr:protein kinase [Rhodothermus sp.]